MSRFLILSVISLPLLLQGQPAYTPMKDETLFREQYIESAGQINTLKASFVQQKSISLLKAKLISTGEYHFKRDGMVRMEYTKPYAYLFILNEDMVYIRSGEKEMHVPTGSSRLFSQISRITLGAINGNILTMKDFSMEVLEDDNRYLLRLDPLNRDMKMLFRQFQVYISKKDLQVERIEMLESSGDTTSINFSGQQVNILLNDALFTVQ